MNKQAGRTFLKSGVSAAGVRRQRDGDSRRLFAQNEDARTEISRRRRGDPEISFAASEVETDLWQQYSEAGRDAGCRRIRSERRESALHGALQLSMGHDQYVHTIQTMNSQHHRFLNNYLNRRRKRELIFRRLRLCRAARRRARGRSGG